MENGLRNCEFFKNPSEASRMVVPHNLQVIIVEMFPDGQPLIITNQYHVLHNMHQLEDELKCKHPENHTETRFDIPA
jgi:hypothetical protein